MKLGYLGIFISCFEIPQLVLNSIPDTPWRALKQTYKDICGGRALIRTPSRLVATYETST